MRKKRKILTKQKIALFSVVIMFLSTFSYAFFYVSSEKKEKNPYQKLLKEIFESDMIYYGKIPEEIEKVLIDQGFIIIKVNENNNLTKILENYTRTFNGAIILLKGNYTNQTIESYYETYFIKGNETKKEILKILCRLSIRYKPLSCAGIE